VISCPHCGVRLRLEIDRVEPVREEPVALSPTDPRAEPDDTAASIARARADSQRALRAAADATQAASRAVDAAQVAEVRLEAQRRRRESGAWVPAVRRDEEPER
jgi:uncharacterized Zn finger protein (UPF0148 family)